MKLKAKSITPSMDYLTGNIILAVEVERDSKQNAQKAIDKYGSLDKPLQIEIKQWRNPRSLGANRYLWELCTSIADIAGITKEDVYRRNLREVGPYEPMPIKTEAVERFISSWESNGTGWIAEVVDDSKLDGYKLVFAYYGSSTYNTKEMYRLIEQVEQDAKSVGVEVISEREKSLMLEELDNAQK